MKITAKKLIIVCTERTRQYSNYLRQLISSVDDTETEVIGVEDGSVEVVVWTEKEYLQNSPTISSNMHILFVGKNKISSTEITTMNIEYSCYGMKYGWLGKRGMLYVDKSDLDVEEYNAFVKYCQNYIDHVSNVYRSRDDLSILRKSLSVAIAVANPIAAVVSEQIEAKKKMRDLQYRALIAVFYYEGLKFFLEA